MQKALDEAVVSRRQTSDKNEIAYESDESRHEVQPNFFERETLNLFQDNVEEFSVTFKNDVLKMMTDRVKLQMPRDLKMMYE